MLLCCVLNTRTLLTVEEEKNIVENVRFHFPFFTEAMDPSMIKEVSLEGKNV